MDFLLAGILTWLLTGIFHGGPLVKKILLPEITSFTPSPSFFPSPNL